MRGEVYQLVYENPAMINSSKAHRPVLIVSSNKGNEVTPFVQILSLTSQPQWGFMRPEVKSTPKTSWVKANEIQSVPKGDLAAYVCTLTESEMEAVDRAMLVALGLNGSVFGENETSEDRIAELENTIDDITIECDTWKRMYDRAIDKLADKREAKKEPVEKKVEFVAEEPQEPVEINTCTAEELRKIGCTPTMIHHIIEKRPYKRVEDLKTVPSITVIAYKLIESRICCVPVEKPKNVERVPKVKPAKVETSKLNINTASAKEIKEFTGIGLSIAYGITGYRGKNGNYKSVEELANVPRLPKNFLEKFRDKLTV